MSEANGLRASRFKYGETPLDELSHAELFEAAETMWRQRNEDVARVEAERDALRALLKSPLPIHSLWRGCVENAMLLAMVAVMAYLAGRQ